MKSNKPILLTSLPRSGSTWVLYLLGSARNVIPFFEPDHLDRLGMGKAGIHPYIGSQGNNTQYYTLYKKIFHGRLPMPFVLRKGCLIYYLNMLQSYLPNKRILVKSTFSLHNTEWIYTKFRPAVVILLRNPFSIISSVKRVLSEAQLGKPVLEDKVLINDYLLGYEKILSSAKTHCEQLASRIGAYYKIIISNAQKHPDWIVVKHEELCQDPIGQFKELYEKLDLCWNAKIEKMINAHNKEKESDDVHHVYRLAEKEVNKWKVLLTKEEISLIRKYYRAFGNKIYDDI